MFKRLRGQILSQTATPREYDVGAADPRPLQEGGGEDDDREIAIVTDPTTGETHKITTRILTADGEPLAASESLQQICALLEDGTFFVSRSHIRPLNPHVSSLRARARQRGFRVNEPVPVDFSTLKAIYDTSRTLLSKATGDARAEETRIQRDFIGLVYTAAKLRASDIHIIANQKSASVRLRVDGILVDHRELSVDYAADLCGAAFALSDESDSSYQPFEPQGARISALKVKLPEEVQSLRLQWDPLVFDGRLLVVRLLYIGDSGGNITMRSLGYASSHIAVLKVIRTNPIGMICFSGPTGSGKSTSMHRALTINVRERNREINLLTVEDPPEFIFESANQMPVTNAKTADMRSEKFSQAIRAALRSDPDVIMIGEIRDASSAKLAFEGAMTGHQIWTTIHTNSAINIIDRLADMGVEPYKVFDHTILTGLVAQRLLRLLCPHCRISLQNAVENGAADPDVLDRSLAMLSSLGRSGEELWARGNGCQHCRNGYVGRTIAAEIIAPDETFMDIMRSGRKSDARTHWMHQMNGSTMLVHATTKMLAGLTGPIEIENAVAIMKYDDIALAALERFQED